MNIIQIISKSKDGTRMQIIAKDENRLKTLHIHAGKGAEWRYCKEYDYKEGKPIALGTINIKR